MYLEFYGLDRPPFAITPDPQFVYLSEPHREALAHLLYGIRQGGGGGFVQLTGEVGTGKTTLSRLLLSQLPEGTQAALVLNPRLGPEELLLAICEELRLPIAGPQTGMQTTAQAEIAVSPTEPTIVGGDVASPRGNARATARNASRSRKPPARAAQRKPPSGKQLFDALGTYLLQAHAAGERVVLIVDEAQNLSPESLEQVRLLTNLETETQKLLQIVLIGQPELRELLARPELRQLAQRITARYHLTPLDVASTEAYLRHRISSAGGVRFPFAPDAVQRLHRRSGGVPRLINIVAERALLGGYAHDLLSIDARTVERAADEALPPASVRHRHGKAGWFATFDRHTLVAAGVTLAAVAAVTLWLWRDLRPLATATDAAAVAVTAAPEESPDAATGTVASSSSPERKPAPVAATAPDRAAVPLLDAAAVAALAVDDPDRGADAWGELRRAWSAPAALPSTIPNCTQPPAAGWECLQARASLDALGRIGRPVLLRLRADAPDAGEGWLLLQGIGRDRARLWLRGQRFDLERAALSAVWEGDYLAVWRVPTGLDAALAAGDDGLAAWLRTQSPALASLRSTPLRPADRQSAARTMTRGLRGFQTAHGLRADGRPGPQTRFALAAYADGPRLEALE